MSAWKVVSTAFGWIYFACWSSSFYPQLWLNYKRQTSLGLSPDFILLNLWGFICYFIYAICLYAEPGIREEYHRRNNSYPLVAINDVFFVSHVLVISCLLLVQAAYYRKKALARPHQTAPSFHRVDSDASLVLEIIEEPPVNVATASDASALPVEVSFVSRVFFSGSLFFTLAAATLAVFGFIHWLDWIYLLSAVKLAATLFKCCPQLYLNYCFKTTAGWSIINVGLDLIGGFTSMGQLVIDAGINDDWNGIMANPLKFWVGMISIVIDATFLYQRYYLYPRSDPWVPDRYTSLKDEEDAV